VKCDVTALKRDGIRRGQNQVGKQKREEDQDATFNHSRSTLAQSIPQSERSFQTDPLFDAPAFGSWALVK